MLYILLYIVCLYIFYIIYFVVIYFCYCLTCRSAFLIRMLRMRRYVSDEGEDVLKHASVYIGFHGVHFKNANM